MTTAKKKYKKLIFIHSLDEIPEFASEDDERDWWATHDFDNRLLRSLADNTKQLDSVLPLQKKQLGRNSGRPKAP